MHTIAERASPSSRPARPHWLTPALFPFESRFITLEQGQIHYVDEGSGPVLLFLHPAPASSFIFREFIAALRKRRRCIALDYPGFGLSIAADDFGFSLLEQSQAVARFVETMNLRDITLVAHDAGGPIGLRAAALAPHRYKAFILSDTFGFPLDDFPLVRIMLRVVSSSRLFRAINRRVNLLPWLVSTLAPVRRRLPRSVRTIYRASFPTLQSRDRILDLLGELARRRDVLIDVERAIIEHFAPRPVLLLYGQLDPVRLLGFVRRFKRLFRNHRERVIPWEGHFPHEGSPRRMIAEIADWLETLESGSDG